MDGTEHTAGAQQATTDFELNRRGRNNGPTRLATFDKEYKSQWRKMQRRALAHATVAVVAIIFQILIHPASVAMAAMVGVAMIWPGQLDKTATHLAGALPQGGVVNRIVMVDDCSEFRGFDDHSGKLIGYLPTTPGCAERPHAKLPVTMAVALKHASFIETVEGPFEGPGVVMTVSAEGMARALYYLVAPGKAGGTIPLQSALEFVAGAPNGLGLVDKSKFLFLWGPSYISHHLPHVDDRRLFAVNNLPCLRPMPKTGAGRYMRVMTGGFCGLLVGSSIGIDRLNDAQRCLVVASYRAQLQIVGPKGSPADHAAMRAQFRDLKSRADRLCLSRRLTGVALDNARADLADIPLPDTAVVLNQMGRFTDKARGVASLTRDANARGPKMADTSSREALTLNIDRNAAMTAALRKGVLQHVRPNLSSELCWGGGCSADKQAHVAMTVARVMADGRVIIDAAYQSRSELLLPRGQAERNTASTSKAMVLPFLLEQGITEVCIPASRWPSAVSKPDGSGMCGPKSLPISLEDAVAVSSNAAFLTALSKVREADLTAYLRHIGYRVDPALSGKKLRNGVVFGWGIAAGPDVLLRNMAFIATGTPVTLPVLFDEPAEADFSFGAYVGARALTRARDMLKAPLRTPYGTVRGLASGLDQSGCGTGAFAKSGTADTSRKLARDRLILGAFACADGDTRVFFSLFGGPTPNTELGRNITSKITTSIVGDALAAYAKGAK